MSFRVGTTIAFACAFPVCLASVPVNAGPVQTFPSSETAAPAAPRITPVVVFGQNARRLPEVFAAEHNLDAAEITREHQASGLIQCGNAHGAGQLTLTDDVITTAAHVLYDETGLPRAESCSFKITVDGRDTVVPVDLSSVVAGSTHPYDVAVAHDWAVARLAHPLSGIRPYGLASNVEENEPVSFVARGHIDWGGAKALSMQDCTLHDQLSQGEEGTREFSFDCDTGDGASGGAVMFDRARSRIGAILVGWRSNHPFSAVPFSKKHYNFAVSIEGGFRQAVYAAANKYLVQK
jgi:hypothetical protein